MGRQTIAPSQYTPARAGAALWHAVDKHSDKGMKISPNELKNIVKLAKEDIGASDHPIETAASGAEMLRQAALSPTQKSIKSQLLAAANDLEAYGRSVSAPAVAAHGGNSGFDNGTSGSSGV